MQASLVNVVGSWVDGDRFWGRDQELRDLTRLIDEGQHVLLVAPRRTGKTSLMREVSRQIADRYTCLHVDLEGSHSPAEAVAEIACATWPHLSLRSRTQTVFRNALAAVKSVETLSASDLTLTFREASAGPWAEKGDALLEELGRSERPVVLFVDELPVLVCRLLKGHDDEVTPARRELADRFLSWLRRATQRRGSLRLVLSGSIGLEPVLRLGRLSATVNAFTPFSLLPWPRDSAIEFVRALAATYKVPLEPAVPERLADRLGACVPYHVQLFFLHLRQSYEQERASGRTTPCTVDEVDWTYRERMLAPGGHAELAHNEERLRMVLGVEAVLAQDLLTEAAVAQELTDEAALCLTRARAAPGRDDLAALRLTLDVLEHDGYLRAVPGRRVFDSTLLRDWWARRFGLGYVPVARRPPEGA
ncbi:MAG: ATP-binding protein [Planctomycetota bacterium]|nr:ATP-binding protein [Planctomycetota bacterium]